MHHLAAHLRVVAALVVREMSTRFGRKPGGYIWALLDPAAHIAVLSTIFMAIAHRPALGTNFPLFFATGYIGFQFYQATAGYLNNAVDANRALLSYPNVAPIDTVIGRFILQLGTTAAIGVCVFTVIALISRNSIRLQWSYILEAGAAASLLALGVSLANNALFQKYPLYQKVYEIITRPMFLLSGVFYLPDALPHPAREIILLNPLAHIIILFRKGFYPEYRGAGLDSFYLYSCAFGMLFMGLLIFTGCRRVMRRQ